MSEKNGSVQPRWVDHLPHCVEECPSHDGKRCKVLGRRPDLFCEPSLVKLANREREYAREFESTRLRKASEMSPLERTARNLAAQEQWQAAGCPPGEVSRFGHPPLRGGVSMKCEESPSGEDYVKKETKHMEHSPFEMVVDGRQVAGPHRVSPEAFTKALEAFCRLHGREITRITCLNEHEAIATIRLQKPVS